MAVKNLQNTPHRDPISGLDLFLDNMSNMKKFKFLEGMTKRFQDYGHTFSGKSMGRSVIYTIDSRNPQTLISLKFNNYGVEKFRLAPRLPFLGEGIFTTDGWRRCRGRWSVEMG